MCFLLQVSLSKAPEPPALVLLLSVQIRVQIKTHVFCLITMDCPPGGTTSIIQIIKCPQVSKSFFFQNIQLLSFHSIISSSISVQTKHLDLHGFTLSQSMFKDSYIQQIYISSHSVSPINTGFNPRKIMPIDG